MFEYPLGEQAPAPGDTIEVAPGVHWLRMPLPSALKHINLWLLDDGDDRLIVDCGVGSEALKTLWEFVFARLPAGTRVPRIFATHLHSDHLGLARWLCRRLDATLWMSAGEYRMAQRLLGTTAESFGQAAADHLVRHGVTDVACIAQARARPTPYPALVVGLPPSFRRIHDGDVIAVGGRQWHAISGAGHSPEHLAFHCPSLGVLIGGDMLLPRISTYVGVNALDPDANPLPEFLRSIDRFLELPADTLVLPSHGEPFRGIATRVGELHAHHDDRLYEVYRACATPQHAADLVPILFPRPLDTHEFALALGEALAHLRALEEDGKVRRVHAADRTSWIALQPN